MLRYFYSRNAAATSKYGKKGSAVKISDVKRDLKASDSLSQAEANLNYLLDRGWVKELRIEKEVQLRGGSTTVPSVTSFYEIAKGIDRIEGGSEFEARERYGAINIQATGANVITLGDGNIVNADFNDLRMELDELKRQIVESSDLSETDKLDAAVDIETIKDQLAKPAPDAVVVRTLWARIERAAAVAGLVELAATVGHLVAPIIS